METHTKVVVVGQGYVGMPLAIRMADRGYQVVGLETDPRRARQLSSGESFSEDVSDRDLAAALDSGRYVVSTDPADCADFDFALITVPTPLRDGMPDVSHILTAATTLARHLHVGATVVLESSTYPGTTEDVVRPALEEISGLRADADFYLGYSPERIDPGRNRTLWGTARLVSGVGAESLRVITRFYASVVDEVVPVSSPRVAEVAKLFENTFRYVNVALANELTMYARDLGVDVWEALEAAASKPFGFMKFEPGPGVGGHCLPIDPTYLSWSVQRRVGYPLRFVELANDINGHMPEYVVRRVTALLNACGKAVRDARILLLGLAYKPNTGDVRESASIQVADRLLALGARVQACDPLAQDSPIDDRAPRVHLTSTVLNAADLVVLLTDHKEFDYGLVLARAKLILDTRHRLDGPNVAHL